MKTSRESLSGLLDRLATWVGLEVITAIVMRLIGAGLLRRSE